MSDSKVAFWTELFHRLQGGREPPFDLAQSLSILGKEKESMEQFAEALRLEGEEQPAAEVRIAFSRGGNRGVQEWRLAYLKQMVQKQYVSPLEFAFASMRD